MQSDTEIKITPIAVIRTIDYSKGIGSLSNGGKNDHSFTFSVTISETEEAGNKVYLYAYCVKEKDDKISVIISQGTVGIDEIAKLYGIINDLRKNLEPAHLHILEFKDRTPMTGDELNKVINSWLETLLMKP